MSNVDAQPNPAPAQALTSSVSNEYRMSRDGRRQGIVLLIGVLSLEVFAVWSLVTILDGGIDGAEWVSALLMVGIALVAPLVAWTLLEEINSRYFVTAEGLRYTSIGGLDLLYPWAQISGFKTEQRRGRIARFFLGEEDPAETDNNTTTPDMVPGDTNNEEEESEAEPQALALQVRESYRPQVDSQIGNPMLRFLHTQAHSYTIPIHSGVENRAELVSQIASRIRNNE
ncbi:MAG: hypothetical protein QOH93_1758 [Chloroflexia bacterium]|jgi:hypothetical protein|nr:hypothetical protein [Chloroflexia bacterium]